MFSGKIFDELSKKNILGIASECQTVWIKIRPDKTALKLFATIISRLNDNELKPNKKTRRIKP